jgi:VanZ family protein
MVKKAVIILNCDEKAGLLNKLRFPNLWLTIGILLIMLVIVASLMPNPPHVGQFRGNDKLGHFAAYIALTFWFGQIYTRNRVRWTIALAFVILGISLEYLQRLSGYRTFEYADMEANAAGVLCALLLAQTPLSRCLAVVERSMLRLVI